jgi:glycosyltransferase involved in cell wall biosynthesis
VCSTKVIDIPHGFALETFKDVPRARIDAFKVRHDLPLGKLIIGVVSRFVIWKGVDDVIEGFRLALESNQNLHLLILNATGPYEKIREDLRSKLPPNAWTAVKFEEDMPAAYSSMNFFVHAPIDEDSEAFGQVYIEALAAGVPSVFTLSGIAQSFIRNEDNALVIPFRDPAAICNALTKLITNPNLSTRLSENGRKSVTKEFNLSRMCSRLHSLYVEP